MKNYTDIHTHIIPNIDDGAQNIEEAQAMLKQAYDDGIRTIIATPHFGIRNASYDKMKFNKNLKELQTYAKKNYPDIKIYPGNELFYGPGIFSGLDDNFACPLANSKYVLVEFPFETTYDEIFHGIRKFLTSGYIPIIAHVERYSRFIGSIDNLEDLVNQGALVQMNASTIVRELNKNKLSQQFSWPIKALKHNLVHFIASDCHDPKVRTPNISQAAENLTKILTPNQINQILYYNPQLIIENK